MNFIRNTLLAVSLALISAASFAAVDVNKATQAELESIKGIGTAASTRILDERKKAPFKDWTDLVDRVRGVGPGNAARFSGDGLTVNGAVYTASAASTAKKDRPRATAKPQAATAGATATTDPKAAAKPAPGASR